MIHYLNISQIFRLPKKLDFLKNIKSTAEHTWLLLLAIARNLYPVVYNVKKNKIKVKTKKIGIQIISMNKIFFDTIQQIVNLILNFHKVSISMSTHIS